MAEVDNKLAVHEDSHSTTQGDADSAELQQDWTREEEAKAKRKYDHLSPSRRTAKADIS